MQPAETAENVVVPLLSRVRLFATPWTAALQASLSFTISWSLLKLMSVESVMPSSHLILCCPFFLLLSYLSQHQDLSSEVALCIWWPKYWGFSFSVSPSNEYSELISLKIDWFEPLLSKGLASLSSTTIKKHQFFSLHRVGHD